MELHNKKLWKKLGVSKKYKDNKNLFIPGSSDYG